MAEISVYIAWITEAKNSANITAQEVEPDVWRAITEVVTIDEKVGNDEVKDTRGGSELSKLFLVCLVEQRKEKTKEAKTALTNGKQTNHWFVCRNWREFGDKRALNKWQRVAKVIQSKTPGQPSVAMGQMCMHKVIICSQTGNLPANDEFW